MQGRRRRDAWLAAAGAGVIVTCLALLIWMAVTPAVPITPVRTAASRPPLSGSPLSGPSVPAVAAPVRARVAAHRDSLAACEARLEGAQDGLPDMAVVGASYTAGTGPGVAALSWAVRLARTLRWNAVIDGVPGAGYVRAGSGGRGPVIRLLAGEDLRTLAPALVIVQAGHDDSGVPAHLEEERVRQAIDAIRAAAPRARIALITVFTAASRRVPAALDRTNAAIIAAGLAADPRVIIMNPLDGWSFARAHDGLHPTAAGDAWIAAEAAAILRAHGVLPTTSGSTPAGSDPVICDSGVAASQPAHGSGHVRGKTV